MTHEIFEFCWSEVPHTWMRHLVDEETEEWRAQDTVNRLRGQDSWYKRERTVCGANVLADPDKGARDRLQLVGNGDEIATCPRCFPCT